MDMIKADHNRLYRSVLSGCSWIMQNICFHTVCLQDTIEDKGQSILLLLNHTSWWDGFIAAEINKRQWGRRFFVMMLERELRKRSFLRKTGAFSIRPESRSILESLKYAGNLLNQPENLLALFPQGRIQSIYNRQFIFHRGVEKILSNANALPRIVFAATMFEFSDNIRPGVYIYLEEFKQSNEYTAAVLMKAYNDFYNRALKRHKQNFDRI